MEIRNIDGVMPPHAGKLDDVCVYYCLMAAEVKITYEVASFDSQSKLHATLRSRFGFEFSLLHAHVMGCATCLYDEIDLTKIYSYRY